ncbi:MAG: hypothetical protein HFF69_05040, partial [Oscillospiraceae bacterium]|nr:hypothetical protein [Oscillospiraceae bacterium]
GLKEDVSGLKEDVSGLKEDVSRLKEDVSGLKEDASGLKEDVSSMQETLTRVAVTQENFVLPQLRLLGEGHKHLEETLAPKDRVESLEGDVAFMRTLIVSLSDRLTRLEQAQ